MEMAVPHLVRSRMDSHAPQHCMVIKQTHALLAQPAVRHACFLTLQIASLAQVDMKFMEPPVSRKCVGMVQGRPMNNAMMEM